MAHFAKVARRAHLPPGTGMMVVGPFDKPMALFNVGGEVFAINAVCPHRGGPLANGRLDHPGEHGVAAYEVQVRRSDIYVGWIKP